MSTCKQQLRKYLDHLRTTVDGTEYVQLQHEVNRIFDAYMTNNSHTADGQSDWSVMIIHTACCRVGVCPPFDMSDYTRILMKASRDRHMQKFTERVWQKFAVMEQQYGQLLQRGIHMVSFIREVFDDSMTQKKVGIYGANTSNRSIIHSNMYMTVIALWTSMVSMCAMQGMSSIALSSESVNREIFNLFRAAGLELKPAAKPIFEQLERIIVTDSSRREPEFRRLIAQVPHKDRLVSELACSRAEFAKRDWETLLILYADVSSPSLIFAHIDRMCATMTTTSHAAVEGIESTFEVEHIDYSGVDLYMFFDNS